MKTFFSTLALLTACSGLALAETVTLWIGTGGKNADGIYRTELDTEKGTLSEPTLAAEIGSPGFVTVSPDGKRLYSICNIEKGSVAAFSIGDDKSLTLINTQLIGDGGAAHLSLDKEGKLLFTAQYGGGSTAVFPILEDGSIGERSDLEEHSGSGPNEARQKGPHPHWAGVSPDNRFLFVPDLGADKVVIYKIDHETATISPHGAGIAVPGGGPRHMKFNAKGDRIFLLNELLMSVTVFAYDAEAGTMEPKQTISTLPEELWEIPNKSAEIRVHPSGKFVYASNRGHDSIAAFAVDERTGHLAFVEREAIRGSWPRNFNLDPSGKWMIVAGRYSNTLSVFRVDQESGGLLFHGKIVNVPSPICVEWGQEP
ncbi:MAG: lactonase family protein [Verrucomicrobiales bacterium]|nr:lactonase family protein [Verrucomicrobiales bacterium]